MQSNLIPDPPVAVAYNSLHTQTHVRNLLNSLARYCGASMQVASAFQKHRAGTSFFFQLARAVRARIYSSPLKINSKFLFRIWKQEEEGGGMRTGWKLEANLSSSGSRLSLSIFCEEFSSS